MVAIFVSFILFLYCNYFVTVALYTLYLYSIVTIVLLKLICCLVINNLQKCNKASTINTSSLDAQTNDTLTKQLVYNIRTIAF